MKAQVSSEFVILAGLAFIIAIAFSAASLGQLEDFRLKKEETIAKDIALKLQKELLIASSVEDGYIRFFEMPDQVEMINYSLSTQNSTITVQTGNSLYIVRIPYSTGSVKKGTNKVNKTEGVVYIN